jgi:hypothetical protein
MNIPMALFCPSNYGSALLMTMVTESILAFIKPFFGVIEEWATRGTGK